MARAFSTSNVPSSSQTRQQISHSSVAPKFSDFLSSLVVAATCPRNFSQFGSIRGTRRRRYGGTRFFIYECALCIPVFFGLTENPGPGWMSVGARFRRKPALDGPARFLFAIRRRVYASYVTRMLVRRAPLVERSAISGFWPLTTPSVAYPWPFGPRGLRILSLVRDNSTTAYKDFSYARS